MNKERQDKENTKTIENFISVKHEDTIKSKITSDNIR